MKYIDLKEFRALGFVQEVNRRVLHPCGLALELTFSDDMETVEGIRIQDHRDDPVGVGYADGVGSAEKRAHVDAEMEKRREARVAEFGALIQER